jgi:phosphoribosylamine--glycine ligase
MKILVIGGGGREHALTWKLRESPQMEEIYCAPGNAGIAQEAECIPANLANLQELLDIANSVHADLTLVGPEAPLVAGLVDEFERAGLAIIGPSKAAAQLEGSKVFAKNFMQRYRIPTARFAVAEKFDDAIKALASFSPPVVIKADGLAAGKGVVVARKREEAEKALDDFMRQKTLGNAGERVVIEQCLEGEEVSFIVLTDGRGVLAFAPAQDHKALLENDQGPNTGGMGAYSDDAILDDRLREIIVRSIVMPTLAGIGAEGAPYRGFLYCGLMLTEEGPKILEYNVRLGDPEAQAILMRLRSDLVDLCMAVRQGQITAVEARWSPNPAVCVVLASRGYPGSPEIGKEITNFEAAESLVGVKVFHAATEARDGHLFTTGGRVLGVTAIGEDLAAAIAQAYLAVSKIHFEGIHYRCDIGAKGLQRLKPTPDGKKPSGQQGRSWTPRSSA